jgi:hypothetical protein
MGNIKYYRGSFTKSSGEIRTMFFVRTEDMPTSFITEHTKGTGKTRNLKQGQETVWDLQASGWRTFNWKTANTEEVVTFEGDENILNNFGTPNVQ